jgi:hypothetical protein
MNSGFLQNFSQVLLLPVGTRAQGCFYKLSDPFWNFSYKSISLRMHTMQKYSIHGSFFYLVMSTKTVLERCSWHEPGIPVKYKMWINNI